MADIAIFRINYKSDFILTLNSDAGWMTPFCIKFWTGAPSKAYFAGWDGDTYTHCTYDPSEPTKLVVQFDDHHLPIGDLKFQIAYHFTVADFPNDVEDEVLNQSNIVTEIDGNAYQVMLDLNGETAPEIQFSLPAYANEAQRIENEQQREQEFAQMKIENAQAVQGAERVNAQLNGTILTVTNRNGQSVSKNVQGPQGTQGPQGVQGPKGDPLTYNDLTPEQKADIRQGCYEKVPNIGISEENGVTQVKSGETFPVAHPDMSSTEAKLLPQTFLGHKVYEKVFQTQSTSFTINLGSANYTIIEAHCFHANGQGDGRYKYVELQHIGIGWWSIDKYSYNIEIGDYLIVRYTDMSN